jgi:hypothetical protein
MVLDLGHTCPLQEIKICRIILLNQIKKGIADLKRIPTRWVGYKVKNKPVTHSLLCGIVFY